MTAGVAGMLIFDVYRSTGRIIGDDIPRRVTLTFEYQWSIGVPLPDLMSGQQTRPVGRVPQIPGLNPQPQQLDEYGRSKKFIDCANKAGLGSFLSKGVWEKGFRFNDESARFVNRIAGAENANAGLLGFTFWEEGRFDIWVGPNPNERNGVPDDRVDWDYGPFQLNYSQTLKDVKVGDYSATAAELNRAFGFLGHNLVPFDNGRIAARKLKFGRQIKGSDRGAAIYFTSGSAERQRIRGEHWDSYGKKFQDFFACYSDN